MAPQGRLLRTPTLKYCDAAMGAILTINGATMSTMPNRTFIVRQVWMAVAL
jgi:hypothetical protein